MALSEKHRSSIYRTLSPMLGEEEAEALLSQFPARELDEPVTQEFVRAEIAGVRTEIADLRAEMRAEIAGVRAEIAGLEARMSERMRQQTIWFMGALISSNALIAAIVAALR